MKDAMLQAFGIALDGLDVAYCAFDHTDKTMAWNSTFLALFPEHEGHVYVGEPYAENLRRFYVGRLGCDELPSIERYIDEGLARHRTQRRPYEFDHRSDRIRVSSFEIGRFGRVRVWRKVAALPEHVSRPVSSTAALAELNAFSVLEKLADGIVIVDVADCIMWANESFLTMYNIRTLTTAIGRRFEEMYKRSWATQDSDPVFKESLSMLAENRRFAGAPFEIALPGDRFVRVIEKRGQVDGRGYFVHVDITNFRRQQAALAATEARYRLLAQYSSDTIVSVEGGYVSYVSPAVTSLLGWDTEEVCGQPISRFRHPDDTLAVAAALLSLRTQPQADYRSRVLHKNGDYVWVEARVRPLPAERGAARRYVINARGIGARKLIEDELALAHRRLEQLASTDALTKLANRRRLDEALVHEARRAKREGGSISLLLLDIDHFKAFNDDFGHAVGDEVLRRVGSTLAAVPKRAGDLAARLGGEEFVLLLPGMDGEHALGVAEHVRQAVAQMDTGVGRQVTVSIGVAGSDRGSSPDVNTLMTDADAALYAAKHAGRNRVAGADRATATRIATAGGG
ncbi:MAG: hypothetical protein DI587_33035 [Variovorax paradoxus]|nr:MAG: hypothetical protein DI583_33035 [Variovorax paradoxus]PZQ02220.1 MAG: hypothetical protein DI587_33035 [Variovorax paradoxus]